MARIWELETLVIATLLSANLLKWPEVPAAAALVETATTAKLHSTYKPQTDILVLHW